MKAGKTVKSICEGKNAFQLKELTISRDVNDDCLKIIASSLSGLEVLRLIHSEVTDEGLRVLSQSEMMKNLRVLDVKWNDISDSGILELSNSEYLKLEEIYIRKAVSKKAVIALCEKFKLKALDIVVNPQNNSVFDYLSKSERLSQLNHLTIQKEYGILFDSGLPSLADNSYITNLTYLDMTEQYMEVDGFIKLFSSPIMSKIKTLIANRCGVQKEGIIALANNHEIKNLTYLSLEEGRIGDGFHQLIHSPIMESVTYLNVSANKPSIGNSGCLQFSNAIHLDNLQELNIAKNDISEVGILGLSFGNLPNLTSLDLSKNVISDEGHQLLNSCIYLMLVDKKTYGCRYEPPKPRIHK